MMHTYTPPHPAPARATGHKPHSVLVLGEALVDVFASGPLAGGAPFNVARTLAALQVPVTCITRLGDGDAWARLVRQSAEDFGLSQAGFQRDDMHPTGSVAVAQKGKTHSFRIAADVAWDYIDAAQAQAAVAAHGDQRFVYFGTLAQRHIVSRRAIRSIVQSSRAIRYLDLNLRNDPDSRRLAEESLALADWVKVNDEELMQLLAWSSDATVLAQDWGSAVISHGIAKLMQRFGLQRLVVTRGALGYASFNADGHCDAQGGGVVVAEVGDTVGAGDGFSAMLMASHLAGCDLASALAMANAYAADICARCGPVPTDPQFYRGWRQQLAARHGEVSNHV